MRRSRRPVLCRKVGDSSHAPANRCTLTSNARTNPTVHIMRLFDGFCASPPFSGKGTAYVAAAPPAPAAAAFFSLCFRSRYRLYARIRTHE